MEDELLYEEDLQETNSGVEYDSEIDVDVSTSKYEETDLYNKEEVTRDLLSTLEEEGYITRSQESTNSGVETTPSGVYYDLLIQMNSHLEYIEEHLYETPSGHDINTPLNQYGLSEILLVGVLVLLGLSFVFNVVKDNVIHIR